MVNNIKIETLYDTGASIHVMSCRCYIILENKPKLIKCNSSVSAAGRGALILVGEYFIKVQISNKVFSDRVIIIENLKTDYILGQVLHMDNRFGLGYSTNDRHHITLNRGMLVQNCSQLTTMPCIKN